MASAAKATKTAASAADMTAEMFGLTGKTPEMPAMFREAADRTIEQAKDFYSKARTAAEDANVIIEDAVETTRKQVRTFGIKALETAEANADASFTYFRSLLDAKTFADAVEIQTSFARKAWDTASEQFRDFQEFAQKAVMDASKPAREAFDKSLKTAAKA